AFVAETLGLEHHARRLRIGVHFGNDRARFACQQSGIDGIARHQFGDERLLADAGQVIGARIIHRKKMPAETLPERAPAVGIQLAPQLRDDLGCEMIGKFGDEQQARLGQQRTIACVPVAHIEEQRTQLAASGVIVGEEEGGRGGGAVASRAGRSRISWRRMMREGAMGTTSAPAMSTRSPASPAARITSAALPGQRVLSSHPSHTPSPRISAKTSRRALMVRSPSMNSAWRAFTPSSTSVVLITSNTALATAQARGFPPYVVP